ncbi:TIGR04222 domain-containing membrane protein [Streptomyces sp. NPDC020412]|uniref:TIGR04222 domain-containing membrane protein n=1 Tax=Streptomyces sp. NPDC020412 TaxID=3365073 RepID=UPI0037A515F3
MELSTVAVLVNVVVGVLTVWLLIEASVSRRQRRRGVTAARAEDARVDDVYEAAFLSGGPLRVVDAAIVELIADERLRLAEPGIVSVVRAEARDAVEQAVLAAAENAPNGSLSTLRHRAAASVTVQSLGHRLAGQGLMVTPTKDRRTLRYWALTQKTVFLFALFASFALTAANYDYDLPGVSGPFVLHVGPMLLVGAVVAGIVRSKVRGRTTKAGLKALADHRTRNEKTESPAGLVVVKGLKKGIEDPTVQKLMVAAAAVAFVAVAAPAAIAADGSQQSVWCGSGATTSCGGSEDKEGGSSCGGGGGSCGGDGGGCGGGGCGGCGGCGG